MEMDLLNLEDIGEALELLETCWQFRAVRVLMAGHQLRVFEALRTPQSVQQVAQKCSIDPKMTERLLIACCSLGIVQREGNEFSLTNLGQNLLLPESPRFIGGILGHYENLWWFWTGLTEVVKTGRRDAAPSPPKEFEERWHEFWIWAMHGIASNGVGQWIAENLDLRDRSLLLDVGGGPGTYSVILCQKFPNLKAVIWDLPRTLAIAEEVVKKFGMEERITLQSGDWNKDEFGSGYDCLLMSNILHGHESQASMKLAKAFRALEPGGLLIVHDFLLNDEKTGPLPAALFNLMVGAYSVREMLTVIEDAGFHDVRLVAYHSKRGAGLVTAVRP
ncbi:MAG: methyltransferase [Armatimonadota bacterium]|nr:methyltransferase [Armatimonadota bacterium]MDW8143925.1 methyltransferase [Armatimonadota bacterium]